MLGIVWTKQANANEHRALKEAFCKFLLYFCIAHCQVSLKRGFSLVNKASLFSRAFQKKGRERGRCCLEFSFLLFVYISHSGERKQLLTSVPALFKMEIKALENGESVADVGRFPSTQMSCSEKSFFRNLWPRLLFDLGHATA